MCKLLNKGRYCYLILAIYDYLDNYLWYFLKFTKILELSHNVKYFLIKYFGIIQFVLELINSENDLRFSLSSTYLVIMIP